MKTPYMLVQDRLSTGGAFILCDAQLAGFPITFASSGFVELTGLSAAECYGHGCGDMIGEPAVRKADPDLSALQRLAPALSVTQLDMALKFMTQFVCSEVEQMVQTPEHYVAYCLVLNRKKQGEFFTNELVMFFSAPDTEHGCRYCVGLQEDLSDKVPPAELLAALCSPQCYETLIAKQTARVDEKVRQLRIWNKDTQDYLNTKALPWKDLRQDQLPGSEQMSTASLITSTGEPTSSASQSTSMGSAHAAEVGFLPSEVSLPEREAVSTQMVHGDMEILEHLAGTWVGTAGEGQGAYVLDVEFMALFETICLRVDGKLLLSGTFTLVTSEKPYHLDISRLDEHQEPCGGSLECILLPDGSDGLHLCCAAAATDPRPTTFNGSGYVRMIKFSSLHSFLASEDARSTDSGSETEKGSLFSSEDDRSSDSGSHQ